MWPAVTRCCDTAHVPAVMNCGQTLPSPTLLSVRAFYCSSRNEWGQTWTGVSRHPVTLASAVGTLDPDAFPHELEHEVVTELIPFPPIWLYLRTMMRVF